MSRPGSRWRVRASKRSPSALGASVLACAMVSMSACTALRPPTLDVGERAVVSDTSADGRVLVFELTASNPNDEPMPMREIRYRVVSSGRTVFTGRRSAESTLAPGAGHTIRLPFTVEAGEHEDSAQPGDQIAVRGRVTYLAKGRLMEVLFDAGLLRPTRSFSGRATVELAQP